MTGGTVLVLQSHRQPLPGGWLDSCLASVRGWAEAAGYVYRFEGDELFRHLSPELRQRTAARLPVAADLARLQAARCALEEGFEAVVWFDADTLIVDPAALVLPDCAYALGREVWIRATGSRLKAHVQVHNAFLLFRAGNPFLDFYAHAAERIVARHDGPMVPQLVGPKLLSALHNLIRCPVLEQAGVLPPLVLRDLLAGGGPALDLFRQRSPATPAAVNLCGSLVGSEVDEGELAAAIVRLTAEPGILAADRSAEESAE